MARNLKTKLHKEYMYLCQLVREITEPCASVPHSAPPAQAPFSIPFSVNLTTLNRSVAHSTKAGAQSPHTRGIPRHHTFTCPAIYLTSTPVANAITAAKMVLRTILLCVSLIAKTTHRGFPSHCFSVFGFCSAFSTFHTPDSWPVVNAFGWVSLAVQWYVY